MADRPQNGADRDDARLRDLEKRLAELARTPDAPGIGAKYEQANLAWRMVTELVTGLGLGLAIGYGLDYLFGTKPFLMVLFIFFGLAAGVKTMMRTASEIDRKSGPAPENDERD
ncbi:AtpZ/AtpI family protein [Paracoccus sp. (in: a-proteobacteria)]|uniref:AtpZ/AtpI family protein n=1 Tax=Paracoccus sp. TaxID=267 RepID=UPI0026DFA5C3|nr:AtpZ/AtpI family protein [Paracoccus sp. (in: a-proteobacteria)]MDO5646858.1 AtpZ/AtpI family protein [Paracoccus sp. (in: a-proteobacteria)]